MGEPLKPGIKSCRPIHCKCRLGLDWAGGSKGERKANAYGHKETFLHESPLVEESKSRQVRFIVHSSLPLLGNSFFALPLMTVGTCVPEGSSTSDVAISRSSLALSTNTTENVAVRSKVVSDSS